MSTKRIFFYAITLTFTLLTYNHVNSQENTNLESETIKIKDTITRLEKNLREAKLKELKIKWEPAPSLSSQDDMFEMNLRGRIFSDVAWISDKDDNINIKATEFRTARLGIEGKAWKSIKYKLEIDFADEEVNLKDSFIEWKTSSGVKWSAGQFKTPNSLDEQTSSRHIALMERASFTDAFELARRIGIAAGFSDEIWTAKIGIFRGSNEIDEENEGYEIASRFTFSPAIEQTQLHLGVSFRQRNTGDLSEFRYEQRPHMHLSPTRFVATERIAEKDFLYSLEFAAINGPVWLTSEYAWLKADTGLNNKPTFSGGYIEAGFFLTGESRSYNPDKGSWDRTKVSKPV